jgi:hypothetical protein
LARIAAVTPEESRHWRERKAYTLDTAAKALGISRRMVAYTSRATGPSPASSRWRRAGRTRPDWSAPVSCSEAGAK